ncbi:hypothetical protein [Hymenobacter koreensis]
MSVLSPEILARASRAARRGEFFRPAELLLALPVVLPAAPPSQVRVGGVSVLGMSVATRPDPKVAGVVILTSEVAYLDMNGQMQQQPLSAATPIRLDYAGPASAAWELSLFGSEPLAVESHLQIGTWPQFPVLVRHPHQEQVLIRLLESWYERRIPVREVYCGQRTILLGLNRTYEETQALKQRYGITLY